MAPCHLTIAFLLGNAVLCEILFEEVTPTGIGPMLRRTTEFRGRKSGARQCKLDRQDNTNFERSVCRQVGGTNMAIGERAVSSGSACRGRDQNHS